MMCHDSQLVFAIVHCGEFELYQKLILNIRDYFNNKIIFITNVSNEADIDWLLNNDIIICRNQYSSSHDQFGCDLDAAARWVQNNYYKYVMFLDYNCRFSGIECVACVTDNLSKFDMVGLYLSSINSVDVIPSAWNVDAIPGSFIKSLRYEIVNFIDYRSIAQLIIDNNLSESQAFNMFHWWDTGVCNWYKLHTRGRSIIIEPCDLVRL